MRCNGCSSAGERSAPKESLAEKQEQNRDDRQKRDPEDQPGPLEPAALAGDEPKHYHHRKRERGGQTDQSYREHLTKLGDQRGDTRGRVLGTLESDVLERPRGGKRGAQQLVV